MSEFSLPPMMQMLMSSGKRAKITMNSGREAEDGEDAMFSVTTLGVAFEMGDSFILAFSEADVDMPFGYPTLVEYDGRAITMRREQPFNTLFLFDENKNYVCVYNSDEGPESAEIFTHKIEKIGKIGKTGKTGKNGKAQSGEERGVTAKFTLKWEGVTSQNQVAFKYTAIDGADGMDNIKGKNKKRGKTRVVSV